MSVNQLELLLRRYLEVANVSTDSYNAGCLFYFNLETFHSLAGKNKIDEIRSNEYNDIVNEGGYHTVQKLNDPKLEEFLWNHVRSIIKKNNIKFIDTCVALTFNPEYSGVRMHIHRESLRKYNPCPFNYTFFLCTNKDAKINFSFIDDPTPYQDILNYRLVDYTSSENMNRYIFNKHKVDYILQHGDAVRFDATKAIHGANNMFQNDEIGIFLVLLGVKDDLPYKLHQKISGKYYLQD